MQSSDENCVHQIEVVFGHYRLCGVCLIVEFCDKVRADRAQRLSECIFISCTIWWCRTEDYLSGCVLDCATVWRFLEVFL